ncbi:MAG: hypothetical protein KJ941_12355 [Bacteroidetes bacterium]|nr:hypothetical protein [Bacteroidota bacterium]
MLINQVSYAQELPKDTLYINDESIDEIITYKAKDSIYIDVKNQIVYLYNEAHLETSFVKMDAGFIKIDLNNNEITATYLIDSTGNKVGKPFFSDGNEEITATSIRYNLNSKKGYIKDVQTQQDEIYLYMGVAKRQANEEIHFKQGRFTTCDLDDPHFHFQLSKAVLIPEKRIVSGPMNLWIKGVPTFLGLPFVILPQQKEKLTGFIFPRFIPSSNFGFGFQDLGYYLPINDYIQTTFYGTLYSKGSFGFKNQTDYYKQYGFRGSITFGFESFRSGFPTNNKQNNFKFLWVHGKESNSNPFWNFSSNVNFNSINNSQFNLDPVNNQYLNNSFNSDIRLDRSFGALPIRSGIKISTRQSTVTKNIELVSPIANFNMTQVYPFKNLFKSSRGYRQIFTRFGVTYDFEGKNTSTFADTLLQQSRYNDIQSQFKNGISQRVTMKTTAGVFKNTLKINPSLNYSNNYNFQTSEKFLDTSNVVQSRVINTPGMSQQVSLNANATTVLYSYYRFVGKGKSLLRHVLTPSLGYSYQPNINVNKTFINPLTNETITYSPFESSVYQSFNTRDASLITFGMNNTLELKRKSDKDTLTGFKKTKLLDNFSISGNYDLLKDSMNLSDLNLSLRISPASFLNFVSTGQFSPYDFNDSTGAKTKDYSINSRGTLGRFLNVAFNTNLIIASKESRQKLQNTQEVLSKDWNADYQQFILRPDQYISFDIPWKLNIAHVYSVTTNEFRSEFNPEKQIAVQTLSFNGDVSFTKRWKLSGNSSFDIETAKITYTQLNLIRDLHCWTLSFNWTPIAQVKFFSFQMNAKSSLFQDAKLRFQKPPFFL